MTSPSSARTSAARIAPCSIAWCRSPIVAHCSTLSAITQAEAIRAGSISDLASLSAPTAATNVPGASWPLPRKGCRDGVQVTTTWLTRVARARSPAASIGKPSRSAAARASASARGLSRS